mmetsp:Transcript_51287/g.158933  ORF Transcript_51287/g.158933 Transcript_51287/m.158933 type:complete len:251 (+) Transcript_51287:73-825(+)
MPNCEPQGLYEAAGTATCSALLEQRVGNLAHDVCRADRSWIQSGGDLDNGSGRLECDIDCTQTLGTWIDRLHHFECDVCWVQLVQPVGCGPNVLELVHVDAGDGPEALGHSCEQFAKGGGGISLGLPLRGVAAASRGLESCGHANSRRSSRTVGADDRIEVDVPLLGTIRTHTTCDDDGMIVARKRPAPVLHLQRPREAHLGHEPRCCGVGSPRWHHPAQKPNGLPCERKQRQSEGKSMGHGLETGEEGD